MVRRIFPRRLEPGDSVAIVGPASPLSGMEHAYDKGRAFLEGRGYRVVEGSHLHRRHLLFAGSEKERAADINEAFADPSISALFCALGGYGSARLLPFLDFDVIRSNPKIFVGYSDITALHIAIRQRTGLATFYGPMVATEMGTTRASFAEEYLFNLLSKQGARNLLEGAETEGVLTLCEGSAEGRLIGGCLSIVAATLGTGAEIDTRGALLCLEDVDELPHRVDRYLTQLLQAGKLQQAKGILFGSFSRCEYPARHDYTRLGVSLLDLVRDRLSSLSKPCLWGLPFGHRPDAITIPLGARARVDAGAGSLTAEPSVR